MQIEIGLEFELEGTILVCIDDEAYDKTKITYGKQYVLDDIYTTNNISNNCVVIDNDGNRASLNRDRFITLEQWREKQLDKLL